MKNVSFRGCSEYTEHFWNMIPGEKQPDVLYQRLITAEDVIEWDNTPRQDDWGRSTIEAGMTLHMMASQIQVMKRNLYIVSEAMTDDIDDTVLEAKVTSLLAAGALLVDESDGRVSIVVRDYPKLVEMWGMPKEFIEDPQWNEIQRLNQRYYHKKHWRELNEYFVANARVFTDAELDVIVNFKNAEAAYFELFPHK